MGKRSFLRGKALGLLLVFAMVTVGGNVIASAATVHKDKQDITSLQIVKNMKLGWNLGNTFDGGPKETSWGNPKTTRAMIDTIKKEGFNTVRIPVTWNDHLGPAPNYTIDPQWLDRVQQVVNYVRDNNMYAIVNLHHEESWIIPTYAAQAQTTNELTKVWAQIAKRFKNYNNHLIFETMNEPRLAGSPYEWSGGTAENRDVINQFNLAAVNTIRSTGGKNKTRFIMIPTYAASDSEVTMDALTIPNNDKRIIVSLHMYTPYLFSMVTDGTSYWGSDADKASMDAEFDTVYNKFVKNGIAVVDGEFGTINKNNDASRVAHASYYVKAAKARGITPIWWDNGNSTAGTQDSYGIFNRNTLTWACLNVVKALVEAAGK
jgi:endoglucanase